MQRQKQLIDNSNDYISIKDASKWASDYLQRLVTSSNISYLLQYGKVNRYGTKNNAVLSIQELTDYYSQQKELEEKSQSNGADWGLSFAEYREKETTKHVHRLHPYKGKFIPQLVEYFLRLSGQGKSIFNPGDIVLDPFCGSGTTLVQANECNMNAIGIDVSAFNVMISNVKVDNHKAAKIIEAGIEITTKLAKFQIKQGNLEFEHELAEVLAEYNKKYFNGPEYRIQVRNKEVDEQTYSLDKEKKLLGDYKKLLNKYKIELLQSNRDTFLGKWFLSSIRGEIDFLFDNINQVEDHNIRKVLGVILSRTIRSCRATTHSDLGTLKEPVTAPYYCAKHFKLCRPIFSVNGWWKRYLEDTINRIEEFNQLRTDTKQICLAGDSRTIDILKELSKQKHPLKNLFSKQKIKGILSSPPYVGLINYHEQHAYSYELLGFDRQDELEIGPLFRGQGIKAKESYKEGIVAVLNNCKQFLQENYDVFLVANDKHRLYPDIAKMAGMNIVKTFKRPVLNRVEKDRNNAYCEEIFHLKEKQ